MDLSKLEGKHTVETVAEARGITRESAINLLSRLKKKGYATVSGGGPQKRIYTISKLPQKPANGFYAVVNKYSPKKLSPRYKHYVHGRYTAEHAIIDGIRIGDARTRNAVKHLFRHVKNWKRLMDLARKHNYEEEVKELYNEARREVKTRTMPERYE